jgi:protein-tyrosine-phosphatase/DNA-binding transcriptional ArsR family regulator
MLTTSPPELFKLLAHEVRWHLLSVLAYSDYRVHELVSRLEKPMNLISYHLSLLRKEGLVHERRSAADARDVYYSVDLEHLQTLYKSAVGSLHPALGDPQPSGDEQSTSAKLPPTRVLFVCTHNSARSQMAEAFLRHLGGDQVEVFSAGTEPATVHPMALTVLKEQTIDASQLYSKHVDLFATQHFDYVITVCDHAREACPVFAGVPELIHWSFEDPAAIADLDRQYHAFSRTLVELGNRIKILLILIERDRRQA